MITTSSVSKRDKGIPLRSGPLGSGPTGPGSGYSVMPLKIGYQDKKYCLAESRKFEKGLRR